MTVILQGKFDRDTINARLAAERAAGRVVYDALCGTGITAKMAARGAIGKLVVRVAD